MGWVEWALRNISHSYTPLLRQNLDKVGTFTSDITVLPRLQLIEPTLGPVSSPRKLPQGGWISAYTVDCPIESSDFSG